MIKWLIKVLWGCSSPCKFSEVERSNIARVKDGTIIGTTYTMRCDTCGRMKYYKFF